MKYAKDAIHKAAYEGNLTLVEEILKTKPNPDDRDSFGGTALHAAMFQSNMKVLEVLVENGYNINAVGPANGYTPMHDAVWGDNLNAVKFLVEKGAKSNVVAKDGSTPYKKAKSEGKADIVKYFESKGIKE